MTHPVHQQCAEACAREIEELAQRYLSPEYAFPQPTGSIVERMVCADAAAAIRAHGASGEGVDQEEIVARALMLAAASTLGPPMATSLQTEWEANEGFWRALARAALAAIPSRDEREETVK